MMAPNTDMVRIATAGGRDPTGQEVEGGFEAGPPSGETCLMVVAMQDPGRDSSRIYGLCWGIVVWYAHSQAF
jgi:hypothetical protein